MRPPIEPMLAKVADALPDEGNVLFEPKWDGFRALVFRTSREVYLQSRDLKPLARYFPDLQLALERNLPASCVLDGEIVIAGEAGLEQEVRELVEQRLEVDRVGGLGGELLVGVEAHSRRMLRRANECQSPTTEPFVPSW